MLKKLFAYLHNKSERFDKKLAPFKESIFTDLSDKIILEIGAGAGLNLRYYKVAKKIYLLEPNQYAHKYILDRIKKVNVEVSILGGRAESIPLPDNSTDAVVSTFVLCSVQDMSKTLKEIHRVLRPKGQLLLIEHIAAKHRVLRHLQKILKPIWHKIADGCDCSRDTLSILKEINLFKPIDLNVRYDVPSAFLKPWLLGILEKK